VSKFFSNRTSVCNLIAAVLLVSLLVLQFMPFWQFGENQEMSASIQGYIWFPTDHKDLEAYFEQETGAKHDINSVLLMPILVLVLGAVGVVLCLMKNDRLWAAAFPTACGAVGLWGYLATAVIKLGVNWGLHLIVCLALVAIGVATFYLGYKDMKNI